MKKGLLLYNMGDRCLARLAVCIHTLREHYQGQVCLLAREPLPSWLAAMCKHYQIDVTVQTIGDMSVRTGKASLWRYSPFDVTLFVDSDTIFTGDPSPLIRKAKRCGLVVTQMSDWRTDGRRMRARIEAWHPCVGSEQVRKALEFGPALNTAVVGWRKDSPILPEWEATSQRGWDKNCTRRLIDELAMQVILHRFEGSHAVVGDEWNYSVKFGVSDDPKIVHFHGEKHVHPYEWCGVWKDLYLSLEKRWRIKPGGDRRLKRWLKTVQSDVTVCTVVNKKYRDRLAKNWPLWMKTKGLSDKPFMVFRVGNVDLSFLSNDQRVTIVPVPGSKALSDREHCLSQFVFNVARHVKTPYWLKLDCDATPKNGEFEWPDYEGKAIVGHRCGYTKVKGDNSGDPRHFLNRLDDWWGADPMFPKISGRIHRHKRTASFCCVYDTQFTRDLAERCGDRLPIPSEDTTAWYAATRWGLTVERSNMKRWFQP